MSVTAAWTRGSMPSGAARCSRPDAARSISFETFGRSGTFEAHRECIQTMLNGRDRFLHFDAHLLEPLTNDKAIRQQSPGVIRRVSGGGLCVEHPNALECAAHTGRLMPGGLHPRILLAQQHHLEPQL